MFIYSYEFKFSKKKTSENLEDYIDYFIEAAENINQAIAFTRDSKKIKIKRVENNTLYLELASRDKLINPTKSLSAITRYLMKNHGNLFAPMIFNKTLFKMNLVSTKNLISPDKDTDISNEELLKGIIDLLYSYTSSSNSETLQRNKAIKEIKNLVKPFIK